MRYYPLFLDLRNRRCVVVGGGPVAERKVRTLLRAGATVTLVSPEISAGLSRLLARLGVKWTARNYRHGDLLGAYLVFAATDNAQVQESIRGEAEQLGVPVNLADRVEGSSFLVPAVIAKGDVQIAISTSGSSPALARMLRRKLEQTLAKIPESLAELRRLRRVLKEENSSGRQRARALRQAARAMLSKGRPLRTKPGVR